jgi:hypothetical protein
VLLRKKTENNEEGKTREEKARGRERETSEKPESQFVLK